ncbi:hypothetical protein [Glycomyces niveus]|uniref:DUF4365 domain-containing protein n=1 Tax=Glycomyces niveus TaxID=2820287 RepID=A0ABS3TYN1_9ACTN|nr:hypothetical protein [Glycomyces sp. NEAU-S30]MBO3731609.1 hypothetical protein [Glycomyces sp. NEAU-S30]
MTTNVHDTPLKLCRTKPGFAVELAGEILGLPIPEYGEVVPYSESLTDVEVRDLNADNVVLCRAGKRHQLGIIIEVQREKDKRKLFSWPAYQVNLRHRINAPVVLIVVCRALRWRPGRPNRSRPVNPGATSGCRCSARLEALMQQETYPYQSKLLADREARGEARGKIEGKAEALLGFIEARGLTITENQRRKIESCQDPAKMQLWVKRSPSAPTVADIID